MIPVDWAAFYLSVTALLVSVAQAVYGHYDRARMTRINAIRPVFLSIRNTILDLKNSSKDGPEDVPSPLLGLYLGIEKNFRQAVAD